MPIKIITHNAFWFQGAPFAGSEPPAPDPVILGRLCALYRESGADILCLQEIQSAEAAATVGRALGGVPVLYVPGNLYPQYGVLLATLRGATIEPLLPDNPRQTSLERAFLIARITGDGWTLDLANTHLTSGRQTGKARAFAVRLKEAEEIFSHPTPPRRAAGADAPMRAGAFDFFLGDLNENAGNSLSGFLASKGFADAAGLFDRSSRPSLAEGQSRIDQIWVAAPWQKRVIDYGVGGEELAVHDLPGKRYLSDHRPVWIVLEAAPQDANSPKTTLAPVANPPPPRAATTTTDATDADATDAVSIFHYNILNGFDKDAARMDTFVRWLETAAPDVLSLNEYRQDDAGLRRRLAGAGYIHVAVNTEATSANRCAVFSRLPIEEQETSADLRFLRVRVGGIDLVNYHASPGGVASVLAETERLLPRLQGRRDVIVTGDFNSFSPADRDRFGYDHPTRPIRDRYLRDGVVSCELIDRLVRAGLHDLDTTPEKSPPEARATVPTAITRPHEAGLLARLDYAFGRLEAFDARSRVLRAPPFDRLSDHYPVLITLLPRPAHAR
jgi:endonuclease/exonuclease/phosphatase family metal-dependent hydrolase